MSSAPPAAGAAPAAPPPTTVNCTINGQPCTFPRGTLIVDAVRQVGRNIPFYCYHPKLAPVGACRVCMVQVEGAPVAARGPIVTTACTTPVFEGLKIETMAEPAKLARKQVLEFLLINHPLDCPVCDKGGECDLQDFTLAYGPGVSGFAETKVHRRKADDLGPFLVLDQERCIMCQRCVRYENEVLGEFNLVLKQRGDHTVIDTGQGEPYAGHFSGNNTELCPVGALTSRTYRFKARPWDVRAVPTVCQACSLGCNLNAQMRGDAVVRLMLRDNMALDGGWLCDRGRYGFGHIRSERRLTQPMVRRDGRLCPVSWEEALRVAAAGLQKGAAVLGGARLTDEEALALSELTRMALGTNDVDWRVGAQAFAAPEALGLQGAEVTSIDRADLIVLVDTCLAEEAPVLDIRLRRAARKAKVVDLGPVRNMPVGRATRVVAAVEDLPRQILLLAPELRAAQAPLIIWNGRGSQELVDAVAETGARVLVPGEFSNARGAEAAGLVPTMLPGYRALADGHELAALWGGTPPATAGRSAREILAACRDRKIQALYLVGANPLRTFPDGRLAREALDAVPFLVVQDLFTTESAEHADVVLPALGPLEKEGTVTGLSGVRQKVRRVTAGPGEARADRVILSQLAEALGRPLRGARPEVSDRPVRLELPMTSAVHAAPGLRVVVAGQLFAGGGTAAFDPNFAPVRGDPQVRVHPQDARGLASGTRVHLRGEDGVVKLVLRLDPGVAPGHAVVAAHDFGSNQLGPWAELEAAPAQAAAGVGAQ